MSEQSKHQGDSYADALAATAIIGIVVASLYVWLAGMPS